MMAGPYRAFSARQGDGGSLRVLPGGRMLGVSRWECSSNLRLSCAI
jgi:hypothetical protein